MATNWTADQQRVIEARNRNLLVSAAAGSGKTAVLVERIIKMVTDQQHAIDIDSLLVMTFTNAAAAEMRQRIGDAIERCLEQEPDNDHLQRQATLVQNANITTIDSFCLKLLREYFNHLDLDPAFRIGDEGELLLLQGEVLEEMLEDWYQVADPDFFRFVEMFASGKGDGKIEDYIKQVYQFAQSHPWPLEWMDGCRKEFSQGSLASLNQMPWVTYLLEDCRIQAREWAQQLSLAIRICQEENGPLPYLPMLLQDHSQMERLALVSGYEELQTVASQVVFDRLAAVRGKDVDPEKKELASAIRARVKKGMEKLKELYICQSADEILTDMEGTRPYVEILLDLAVDFGKRLQEKKGERNLVDFNDLEHFALELLISRQGQDDVPTAVADELSRRFVEILVDEYQDSNLVQEALISSLSSERLGRPNVFMVGDVKQSIYKFRLARPELFLEKYKTYQEVDGPYQKIELHQNFRSRFQVLESINQVFDRIMDESLGGISYSEKIALHPGAVFEPLQDQPITPTELWLVNTDSELFLDLDEDTADYTGKEIEARLIASRIQELTDPQQGLSVWDSREDVYRKARYQDIVILLRSVSGFSETLLQVLASQGIPAFAESRTGYFTAIEVETVLCLLAVIDNPMQDIPLAAVLCSPIGGVSDRQLANMTATYKAVADKGMDRGLYAAVQHYMQLEQPQDPGLQEKLVRLWDMVKQFQYQMTYFSLHQLLYQIYDQTGYYDYVSAMPAGEVRQANLDMLVEKAAVYEASSYKGLFQFIRYIEKLKSYHTDFGEASTVGEHDNTVRIMSIHKSKGLEFPIVILGGMAKAFNRQDVRGKLLIDPDLGLAVDYMDPDTRLKAATLKKNVLKRRMDLENLGEELRVLYVAMTRAKEKLIMTAADRNLETKKEKWSRVSLHEGRLPFTILSTAGSYLDWMLMSLSAPLPAVVVMERQVSQLLTEEIGNQVRKETIKADLLSIEPGQLFDPKIHAHLQAVELYRYPYQRDISLHIKTAVSELKQRGQMTDEQETAFLPTLPQFLLGESQEHKGVYKGTAYHRAMELLPFHQLKGKDQVCACLNELVEKGLMLQESREMVDDGLIARFLESDLGQRMAVAQAQDRLHKEQQFVIGVPANRLGQGESEELVLIQGIIDAYFEEEGSLILVDYKTDRLASGGEHILRERYGIQLDYYQLALEQMIKRPVKEKIIYSYHLGEIQV